MQLLCQRSRRGRLEVIGGVVGIHERAVVILLANHALSVTGLITAAGSAIGETGVKRQAEGIAIHTAFLRGHDHSIQHPVIGYILVIERSREVASRRSHRPGACPAPHVVTGIHKIGSSQVGRERSYEVATVHLNIQHVDGDCVRNPDIQIGHVRIVHVHK